MTSPRAHASWFIGYVQGVTDRDIGAIARGQRTKLGGQQLVITTLAEKTDHSRASVRRYTELLVPRAA